MNKVIAIFGNPTERTTPGVFTWLRQSKIASVAWLAVRVWIGIMWFQAGWSKVFGAENPSFLHNNGAGVAGFAGHGARRLQLVGQLHAQLRRPERQLDRRHGRLR